MPVIKYYDTDDPTSLQILLSTMLFPNSRYLRDSHEIYTNINELLGICMEDGTESVSLSPSVIQRILNAPSAKIMLDISEKAMLKGLVAGDILSHILIMDLLDMEEPSLRKAIYISTQNAVCTDTPKVTDVTIRKYWEEYKSVAHYWAAHHWILGSGDTGIELPLGSKDDVIGFLSIANELRIFGENFTSWRNKDAAPLLDKKKLWTIPDEIELPTVELDVSNISDNLRATLEKYTKRDTYL